MLSSMKKKAKGVFENALHQLYFSRFGMVDSKQQCSEPNEIGDCQVEPVNHPQFKSGPQHVHCFRLENDYKLENLMYKEIDLEFMGPNDVFVEVHYVGLNFSDVYSVKGIFLRNRLPYIPGLECSGIVLAVGKEVDSVKVGDTVMVFNPAGGLLMERVIVNKNCVFRFGNLKYGAALIVNYLTAMEIIVSGDLFKFFGLEFHQRKVLFHSCSGGVGSAFYDLTKYMEIKHLGTCSVSKHNSVKYECFDYKDWDVDVSLKYPDGVDMVIETISGPNTKRSLDVLKMNGHLFVIGAYAALNENPRLEEGAFVNARDLIMKNISVTGVNIQTLFNSKPIYVRSVINFISHLCDENLIEPHISAVFEFHQTVDAIKYLMDRKNIGKVLIRLKKEE